MSSTKSLYDILGVTKNDSCASIKKAYFKLARVHHPDKGGNPETFKEITRASDILTDERKRRIYDETGMTDEQAMDQHGGGGFPGFPGGFPGFPPGFPGMPGGSPIEININDLFGRMFGNPPTGPQRGPIRKGRQPPPNIQEIPITLEQFYLGHKFDININRQTFCTKCEHTGAISKEMCRKCNGQGQVAQIIQMGPMQMHAIGPCLDCSGKGEKILEACNACNQTGFIAGHRNLTVNILPGTRADEVYIFSEVCSDLPEFERPGDVHIKLKESPTDSSFTHFKRIGTQLQHLETSVYVCLSESLLGCVVQINHHPGYDEGLFVELPPGCFQNDTYCLSGFGMPIPGSIGKYGDLFIKINVNTKPWERHLFKENALEKLGELFQDKVRKTECEMDAIQREVTLHLQ